MLLYEKEPSFSSKTFPEREPAVYQLQASRLNIFAPLLLRCVTIGTLVAALALGSATTIWPMTVNQIWSPDLSADIQLLAIGLVNKMLDYAVTNAFEHISLLSLTLWMTQESDSNRAVGVNAIDFEMKEEMLKPWVAIHNLIERYRLFGFSKKKGMVRSLASLGISLCFLFQGAAMNTIGFPKHRWYPEKWPRLAGKPESMTFQTFRRNLTALDWTTHQQVGLTISSPPEATLALQSASTFVTLNLLDSIYGNSQSWSYVTENSAYITALHTSISASTVESVSIQTSKLIDIYKDAKQSGSSVARLANGMKGTVKLTVPMLTTTCNDSIAGNGSAGTITVKPPEPEDANGYLTVQIAPQPSINFTGASCTLRLRQALFPFEFTLSSPNAADIHPGAQNGKMNENEVDRPSITEIKYLGQLARHFDSMLPNLNGLLLNSSFAEQLVVRGRSLRAREEKFKTDVESLAPAVALTLQYLITTATWTMEKSPILVTSSPVEWSVTGSGPRVLWQWAIGSVLAILIIALSYDVYLVLWYRIAPGPWLTLAGMMNAANAVDKMVDVPTGCAGVETDDTKKVQYYIRDLGYNQAELTDNPYKGSFLEKGKRYGGQDDQVKDDIRSRTLWISSASTSEDGFS